MTELKKALTTILADTLNDGLNNTLTRIDAGCQYVASFPTLVGLSLPDPQPFDNVDSWFSFEKEYRTIMDITECAIEVLLEDAPSEEPLMQVLHDDCMYIFPVDAARAVCVKGHRFEPSPMPEEDFQ